MANLKRDPEKKLFIEDKLVNLNIRNIDALLEEIIFEQPVGAVIIIDQITDDLREVINQLTMNIEVVEFHAYVPVTDGSEEAFVYKFTPFQQDIQEFKVEDQGTIDLENVDTVVVPANKRGFEETFIGEDRWGEIQISKAMIDKIKYLAVYQTTPVSAITHYAEVSRIEKHRPSGKMIVIFEGKAKKLKTPLKLVPKGKVKGPQSRRYTNYEKLMKAKDLDGVF